jgi:threonine/homoserine/homoserine lactone efflux protein
VSALTITLQAVLLGLGAGLAPGPLLALVMTESLRGGARAGMRVAVAPLITDAPIVAASWALAGSLDARSPWLAALSLGGALVVGHLAVEQWRAALPEPGAVSAAQSLLRGAAVNLLSPYPWLFWITLGGPLLAGAAVESVWAAIAFLGLFYLLLVGTKVVLALVTGRWGRGLTEGGYRRVCRVLALALLVFAARLAWDGIGRLAEGLGT